jgi:hypothetical protein
VNLRGSDRQRTGPIEHANVARQVVMGSEIAMKLSAVALLDNENARFAVEGGCELLRLGGR